MHKPMMIVDGGGFRISLLVCVCAGGYAKLNRGSRSPSIRGWREGGARSSPTRRAYNLVRLKEDIDFPVQQCIYFLTGP